MSRLAPKCPLLLCSLGNPGVTYSNTRHNVGHRMLELYRKAYRFPEFVAKRDWRGSTSSLNGITLFQSAAYMNVSGPAVLKAFQLFTTEFPAGKLCVLHDELSYELGVVKLRPFGKGKGHNGIRSCCNSLGTDHFHRLQIGISRPASRESALVSAHVLGPFTQEENRVLETETLPKMIEHINVSLLKSS